METLSIFDMIYDEYKINKPIRLIECFAGYGSQALALKYLGANFEHHKICEWAINSIIAYASLHRNELKNYGTDYSLNLSKEEIAIKLHNLGVSIDYNKPATLDQLKRVNEDKLRLCYNSIMWSNNLVDISKVKGNELNITDTNIYIYILTYSFPCQDLSLAGKGAGMVKGSGTRSGLLWEVERLLTECKDKPQVLLMENVSQVHGAGNDEHFKEWQLRLEEMGYQSYWEDLTAVNYGIPQTRNRTFMVSILGDYNYRFPKPIKLKLRLKDLLESNVDEKYYISQKMIEYISATGGGGSTTKIAKLTKQSQDHLPPSQIKEQEQQTIYVENCPEETDLNKPEFLELYNKLKNSSFQQQQQRIQEKEVCDTLLARDYKDPKLVIEKTKRLGGLYDKENETHQAGSIYDSEYAAPTLDCSSNGGNRQPFVIEKGINNKNLQETLKQTNIDEVNDVAYLDAYNKNAITDGTAKTILSGVDFRNQDFLLIKNATKKGYLEAQEGDGIDISSRMDSHRGTVQKNKAQTITTMGGENIGVIVKDNIPEIDKVEVLGNYSPSNHESSRIVSSSSSYPTVKENHGTIPAVAIDKSELVGGFGSKGSTNQFRTQNRVYSSSSSPSITTAFNPNYEVGLRIRKLTPKECFRLMGVKDEDIDLIMENQTNASGYHLAGDSIVVNVLMAIFGNLIDVNWKEKFKPEEWWKGN